MPKTFMLSSSGYLVAEMLKEAGYTEVLETSGIKPDFLVIPGGSDVNPALYFAQKDARTTGVNNKNDIEEMVHILAARMAGVPQLGICRGMQLLHVSSGGSLVQHVEGHSWRAHEVYLGPGKIISTTSSHHQAVPKEETKDYEEVYFSEDGVVEAIISPKHNWGGVQWHPEYKTPKIGDCRKFFIDMIETLTTKKA
jgi:gamma-glutamyl-gamma-aminobutyrate hydrolase PuuD